MRFKSAIRSAVTTCSGAWFGRAGQPRRVVFCYHSIHPSKPYASATPEAFALQLDWLSAACEIVPFTDIALPRAAGSKPAVAITFDDGYADNHEHALPILARHGATATFFLTAGLVARDSAVVGHFARDRRCSSEEIASLSWEQVRDLHAAGMTIGAHTWSHANLAHLSQGDTTRELVESKRVIEEHLGVPVTSMAYPYGKRDRHFTSETMRAVSGAGYETAASVLFRGVTDVDDRRAIPRFFVNGADDLRSVQAKVRGDWDAIGWWQETSPLWAAKLISPSDFSSEAVRA